MKKSFEMKKIIVFCLVIALAFSVVGCGKKASTDNNTATPTTAATVTPTTAAPTTPAVATATPMPTIAEKDKVSPPPTVLKVSDAKNKKLTAAQKARLKKILPFTQNLANDKRILSNTVAVVGKTMVGTIEVKPEITADEAKTMAGQYAKEMNAAYGQSVKVIINQKGKLLAESSL